MTSVEPPIDYVENGKPVHQKFPSKYEKKRNEYYAKHMSPNEVQFTKDVQKIFGSYDVTFKKENVVKWVSFFLIT